MTNRALSHPDSRDLLETAVIGREIEDFLNSTPGKYLTQCADIEEQDGLEILAEADPTDTKSIVKAQAKVFCGRKFRSWLIEAVSAGLKSQFTLEQREQGADNE